jgi:hypothetical protein
VSTSFEATQWHARSPYCDGQTVAAVRQPGQHHLVELRPEQLAGRYPSQVTEENGPTSHSRIGIVHAEEQVTEENGPTGHWRIGIVHVEEQDDGERAHHYPLPSRSAETGCDD